MSGGRSPHGPDGRFLRSPDPTPDELRERCLMVQAEWSDDEREKRTCPAYRNREPLPPGVKVAELRR